MSAQTILVTGGAGFVGSHLIERLLTLGYDRIICLDNYNDYYDPDLKRQNVATFSDDRRVAMVESDFCDAAANALLFEEYRITHVFHLGAYAGVRASVANPLVYERNNVGGTLALLEAARHGAVERFLLVSSSTVYGRGAPAPFIEDMPLGVPLSPYGATKRAAELLGLTYVNLHAVPVVCLRPFSVYGPRLRPDLALAIFTEMIDSGRPLPLFGDGTIRRDFTHVYDICEGLISAMTAEGVVGECLNLGHAEPLEMRAVIAMLEDALGKRARIERHPERAGEMPITFADLSKAEKLLGYRPRVPFVDGVREYVGWHRTQRLGIAREYAPSVNGRRQFAHSPSKLFPRAA